MHDRMLQVIHNELRLIDHETARVSALDRELASACVIGIPSEEIHRIEMALRNGRIEAEQRYRAAVLAGNDRAQDRAFQDFSNFVRALTEELAHSQTQAVRAANARVDALRARMRSH